MKIGDYVSKLNYKNYPGKLPPYNYRKVTGFYINLDGATYANTINYFGKKESYHISRLIIVPPEYCSILY